MHGAIALTTDATPTVLSSPTSASAQSIGGPSWSPVMSSSAVIFSLLSTAAVSVSQSQSLSSAPLQAGRTGRAPPSESASERALCLVYSRFYARQQELL